MRNSANVPAPLVIENAEALNAEPVSTTAKFEEYMKNRERALQITAVELRKISEKEREQQIYQYLTPDEIWMLRDALKKVSPVEKIKVDDHGATNDKRVTVEDFILHEQKRHEFKAFTDEDLKNKPPSELEYYYQFLTTDELLEQNEKLASLRI